MFERVIVSILTRLLGEYVEDSTFSAEKVQLGIWRGDLVLEELHIKKSLIDTLELPLTLRHGIIGRLEIRIPWKNLGKDPIVVVVDRVFLVVEPKFEWDADAVKRREKAVKRAKLAAADLFRTSPLDDAPTASEPGLSKGTWGSGLQKWVTDRLINRIVDSLQIHVEGVHLRYEDHISHTATPFFVGVTMESLHAASTDQEWQARPRPRSGPIIRSARGVDSSSGSSAVTPPVGAGEVEEGQGAEDNAPDSNSATGDNDDDAASAGGIEEGGGETGTKASAAGWRRGRGGARDQWMVKKAVHLNQLAVYWNPTDVGNACSLHLSDIPVEQAEAVFSRLIARKCDEGSSTAEMAGKDDAGWTGTAGLTTDDAVVKTKLRHRYILEPVDATARVALSLDPMDRSQPRLQAHVDVGRISGRLEDFQLQNAICLGAMMARHTEIGKYSKYRPDTSVLAEPSAWWRYAFAAVVEKLRAERGVRTSLDIAKRRRLRLEYMPLWQKSLGWLTQGQQEDDDAAASAISPFPSPRSPRNPGYSGLKNLSDFVDSPRFFSESVVSVSSYSSDWQSSAATDDYGDGEVAVWGMGLGSGGGGRGGRAGAGQQHQSRRQRLALAKERARADKRRLEELEEQLSVEDIIVFRAMAESEARRGLEARNKEGNQWGIGGWVSWALGSGASAISEGEEEGPADTDEMFRRLFAAIDVDPSKAPPTPPAAGEGEGPASWGGWLAMVLDLRASQGSFVLAAASSSAAGLSDPKAATSVLAQRPEEFLFMEACFRGFCLSVELHGEDMDGVLASVALEDLAVYEIHRPDNGYRDSQRENRVQDGNNSGNRRGNHRGNHSPPLYPGHGGMSPGSFHYMPADPAHHAGQQRSRIVTRRRDGPVTVFPSPGTTAEDAEIGISVGDGGWAAESKDDRSVVSPSDGNHHLFEMHFEMNPRDPEYGAKVFLAIDQVEAVLSPTAGWLASAMAFTRVPEGLEHRATLELAATTRLKNLRAQLESKLEMVMSDRLRVFLDLDVKAPLLVVPIDLATTAAAGGGDLVVCHDTGDDLGAARVVGGHGKSRRPEKSILPRDDGSGSANVCAPSSTTRELLVVDLGSVSLSTSRLAHLRNTDEQQQESDERMGILLSASSGSSDNGDYSSSSGWERTPLRCRTSKQGAADDGGCGGGDGDGRSRQDSGEAVSASNATPVWMKTRASSSVGPAREATGRRWHANFYDVYNVDVSRVGVLLKRNADHGSSYTSGGDGRDSRLHLGGGGGGMGAGGWLVDPFDVKVELHLSVIPNDPCISQLKVYGDLPKLHVRLSQGKLQRMVQMSAALAAQSVALEALQAANRTSTDSRADFDKSSNRSGSDAGSVTGSLGGAAAKSSLASFLEFQQTLSQRFDRRIRQVESSGMSTYSASEYGAVLSQLGSARDFRRLHVSQDSLGWSGSGGDDNGSITGGEYFRAAWGGPAGGGSARSSTSGSAFGSAYGGNSYGGNGGASGTPSYRSPGSVVGSLSGESEFYDAVFDGSYLGEGGGGSGSSPAPSPVRKPFGSSPRVSSPPLSVDTLRAAGEAAAAGVEAAAAIPPQLEVENMESRENGCLLTPLASGMGVGATLSLEKGEAREEADQGEGDMDDDDDDDGMEFEDARDPVSEMDEALMAKEAERAELMKQRQRIRVKLAGDKLAENELDLLRSEAAEVTKSLEACEDELKDLTAVLEQMVEVFEQAGRENSGHLAFEEAGVLLPPSGGETGAAAAEMPSSSPFFPPPPVREHRRRTVPNYAASPGGRNAPSTAAVKAGPNREIIMCGLTVPLIQVDLLQDKSPDMSRHRGREEQETTRGGGLGDEEEVASLCLIGLGMQLHSKSHGARFSFSMQDIDLEDRLQPSATKSEASCATKVESQQPLERRHKNIATSKPQLPLWEQQRPSTIDVSRRDTECSGGLRRAVTFSERDHAAEDHGIMAGREESQGDFLIQSRGLPERAGRIHSGGGDDSTGPQEVGRDDDRKWQVSRPDFLQLSYAMKTIPRKAHRSRSCGQETHRVKLLVGALEISLEQATILALLRITSSAMPRPGTRAKATPAALSPTATVLLEPAAVSSGRQHPSAMPQPSLTPTLAVPAEEVGEEEVKAAHPDVATTEGESDSALLEAEAKSSAGAMMIPMMPSGVTVTLSVDVAAVGVVLTESGARVAAVTISAATCKVNAGDERFKAAMILGDLSVLNTLPPTATTTTAPTLAANDSVGIDGDSYLEDGSASSVCVEQVLGRKRGAAGPLLDITLVVIPSARRGERNHGHSKAGGQRNVNGGEGGRGEGDVEARAKVRVDKLNTVISLPFVESVTRHVLTGPLVSHLLKAENVRNQENKRHVEASVSLPARTPAPPPRAELMGGSGSSSAFGEVHSDGHSWAVGGYSKATEVGVERSGSSSLPGSSNARVAGRNHADEVSPLTDSQPADYQGKRIVLFKIQLEVCELALELPLEQDSAQIDDKCCVAATLGHGIAAVIWVPPTHADMGGSGRETLPATLQFEVAATSAGVRVNPERFDLLEDVHTRIKGVLPLDSLLRKQAIVGTDQRRGGRGDATINYSGSNNRDELLEKLREKCRPDDVEPAALLPARPVLLCDETVGDGNAGIAAPCAQFAVTLSPVRLNLAECHILSFACLAVELPSRVGKLTALFAPPSPPSPTLPRGDSDSAMSEAPSAGSVVTQKHQGLFRSDGTVLLGSIVEGSALVTTEPSPMAAFTSAGAAGRGSSSAWPNPSVRSVDQEQEQKQSAKDGANTNELPSRDSLDTAAFFSVEETEETHVGAGGPTNVAPIPPPFWGTLIVQAVSVMVWENQTRRGNHQPSGSSSRAPVTVDAHVHSPLLHLDVQAIGVGVDLAPRSPISSSEQQIPSLPRAEEDGAERTGIAARKRRVEMAIKRISVTDASRTRRPGSVVRLFGNGVGDDCEHISESAVTGGNHRSGQDETVNSNADDAESGDCMGRILRAGWWEFGAINETYDARDGSGYEEQFLLRAFLCPVSNEVCIKAALTSGQFMVLPAPILDVLKLTSNLEQNIVRYAQSVHMDAMFAPVPVVVSSSRQVTHEGDSRGPDQRRAPNLPSGGNDHADERAEESWRQVFDALGGSAVWDTCPWLQRVHLEISANRLQLWLPDIVHASAVTAYNAEAIVVSCSCELSVSVATSLRENSRAGMDPALDSVDAAGTGTSEVDQDSRRGEEAKGERGGTGDECDAIALSGKTGDGHVAAPDASLSASAGDGTSEVDQDSRRGEEAKGERCGTGDKCDAIALSGKMGDDRVAAPDASPSASGDCCEDVCVVALGLHNVEVFVARPSLAVYRMPIVPVPNAQTMARVVRTIDPHSRARGVDGFPSASLSADSMLGDPVECDAHVGEPEQAGVDDRGGSQRRSLEKTQRVVLPFNFDLSHVLTLSRCPLSWSSPLSPSTTPSFLSSPIQSRVDVAVTEIRLRWFVEFPLAARVLATSIMPLVMQDGAPPVAPLEAAGDRRYDHRFDGNGERKVGETGVGNRVTTAENAVGTSVAVWSKLAAMWTCYARLEAGGLRMTIVNNLYRRQNMPALDVIVAKANGELAATGALKRMEGRLSMLVGSDFYNTRVMAWEPLVEPWEARLELEVDGGAPTAQAGVIARPRVISTMAAAQQQQQQQDIEGRLQSRRVGISEHGKNNNLLRREHGGTGASPDRSTTSIKQGRGSRGRSYLRVSEEGSGAVEGERLSAGNSGWDENNVKGADNMEVRVRLVSEQTLNANLTESLVESLAPITLALQQQQQQQVGEEKEPAAAASAGWISNYAAGECNGANDDLVFSRTWGRNETGLAVVCSSDGYTVGLSPGEERPLPLSYVSVPRSNAVTDDDSTTIHTAAGSVGDTSDVGTEDAACGEIALPVAPGDTSNENRHQHGDITDKQSRSTFASGTGSLVASLRVVPPASDDRRLLPATGAVRRSSLSSPSSSSRSALGQQRDQQRDQQGTRNTQQQGRVGLRAVVLEILDGDERTGASREVAGSPPAGCWRSLRPIQTGVVGQRLVTMVASTYPENNVPRLASVVAAATAAAARATSVPGVGGERVLSSSSPSRYRRPGGGTWSGVIAAARGAKITKVVAEVESHHGVKVVRVRSLVEITNGMDGPSLRVGLLREKKSSLWSLGVQRRGGDEPRFEWETVVHAGKSCPVPASMALAVAEGKMMLAVKPISQAGREGEGSSKNFTMPRAVDELEEAFLTLPRPDEWSAAGERGGATSYRRTLLFAGKSRRYMHGRRPSYRFGGNGGSIAGDRTVRESVCPPAFCAVRAVLQGPERCGKGSGGVAGIRDGSRGGRKQAGQEGLVIVLSFEPTMSVTNLLAAPADVRLACPSAIGGGPVGGDFGSNWSRTIQRGSGMAWMNCAPHEEVKMSIRLPGFEWSDAITLPAPRDADTATARNAEEANAHYGAENAATAETARSYAFPGTRTNGRHDAEGYAALTSSTSMSSLDDQQARWHREKATGRGLGSLGIDVAGTVLVHAEFQLRECSRDSDDSNGGASLCVHADVSVPSIGGGVRSVSLWVPYWVVNTTSLSLGFRHDPFALGMVSGNKGRQSPSGAAAAQEEEVIVAPARTTAAVAAAAEANETDGNGTSSTRRTSLASSFSAAGTDRYDGGSGAERREAAVAVAVRGAPVNMANDRHRGSSGGASSPGGGTLSRVEAILGMGANEERLLSLSAAAVEEEGPPGAKFTAVRGGVARRRNSSRHQRSSSPKLFQQPALLGLQHLVEDERATRIIGGGGGISSGGRDEHGREDSRGIEGTARQRELRAEDDDHDPDSTRFNPIIMASYTNPETQQGRLRVRVEGSTWSQPIGLDQAGVQAVLELMGKPKAADDAGGGQTTFARGWGAAAQRRRTERQAFAVGVTVKPAPAPFIRTKVVELVPRYVIVNATGRGLEVQQTGIREDIEPLRVLSGTQEAFHWPEAGTGGWFGSTAGRRFLKIRMMSSSPFNASEGEGSVVDCNWSGQFSPEGVVGGDVTLRLTLSLSGNEDYSSSLSSTSSPLSREVVFVRVEAVVEGASLQLVFRNELPSFAPYQIDNFSLETLTLRQVGAAHAEAMETLLPYQSCAYSWDEPLGERSLIVERFVGVGEMREGSDGNRSSGRSITAIMNPATTSRGTHRAARRQAGVPARGRSSGQSEATSSRPPGAVGRARGRSDVLRGAASSTMVGVYTLDLMVPPATVGNLNIGMEINGPTRTLRFMDARTASSPSASPSSLSRAAYTRLPFRSLQRPVALRAGVNAAGTPAFVDKVSLSVSVRLECVGVSVIDVYPRELLYVTARDIALDYVAENQTENICAGIGHLQVDNQLVVTPYPALLYPVRETLAPRISQVPAVAGGGQDRQGCFEVNFQRDLGCTWAHVVRLASLQLAPFDVNLDGALVNALLELSSRAMEYMEVGPLPSSGANFVGQDPGTVSRSGGVGGDRESAAGVCLDIETPARAAQSYSGGLPARKLYLEEVAISPIRLYISYTTRRHNIGTTLLDHLHLQSRGHDHHHHHHEQHPAPAPAVAAREMAAVARAGGGGGGGGSWVALRALLRALGTTLSQIENAPVLLNALTLSHTTSSPGELVQILVVHYKGQAVRQVLGIMGSSELLGNPVGLLVNIAAGVKDFLYEPIRGLNRSPFGFASGVFKGTSSLVRRTLYSCTDTVDRIASSVSSGILASGAVDVSVRGGRGVVRPFGIFDGAILGFAGAVREPLMGFRVDGFHGMAKGLITGSVGLVLRPTYGTLLSTSQVCQVISGYLDPRLDSEQKLRMLRTRPPRFFRSREQILSVYSREENVGEELLSRVHMGRYRSDGYVWHTGLKDMIVLVTGRRLLMLHGAAAAISTIPQTNNIHGRERDGSGVTPTQHSYGVVKWEVEFDLMVWLERTTNYFDDGEDGQQERAERGWRRGSENRGLARIDAPGRRGRQRGAMGGSGGGGRVEGRRGTGGGEDGTTVLVYHFPNLYSSAVRSSSARDGHGVATSGADGRRALASLRFERRTMVCVDRAQAARLYAVLADQMPVLAHPASFAAGIPPNARSSGGGGGEVRREI